MVVAGRPLLLLLPPALGLPPLPAEEEEEEEEAAWLVQDLAWKRRLPEVKRRPQLVQGFILGTVERRGLPDEVGE